MPKIIPYLARTILFLTVFLLAFAKFLTPSYAVFGLGDLSVITNNDTNGEPVEIDVSFILPINSAPINNTDYIQIYLTNFSDVTAPSLITGYYAGIPIYSASGVNSKVTNVTVLPSSYVRLENIRATNPVSGRYFQVMVMVTEDEAGTIVKNIGWAIATPIRGSVTVTATIERELASLYIAGLTAPDTFIIFTEGSSIIGTDVAGPNGAFNHIFTGLSPEDHTITFYGVDPQNRATSPITIEVYTPAHQQINVTNQLLSPTVSLSSNRILQGGQLVASGSAIPNGNLTLFTDAPLKTFSASVSASGSWSYSIDTSEYIIGDFRMFSLVQNNLALQSLTSLSIPFTIYSENFAGTACGDISHGDLNCDTSIDLTDFSILMYYWGTANAAADINLDYLVNLNDFSIMMYYWGT